MNRPRFWVEWSFELGPWFPSAAAPFATLERALTAISAIDKPDPRFRWRAVGEAR